MNDKPYIRKAEFDPKVKTYWLFSAILVCVLTVVGIPLLILVIPIGMALTGRYLSRMECLLTEKALKVKKGILVRVEKTIPLEKITDMAMVQGPLMRHFGIFKLTVETAGQSGAGALVALTGIVDAKGFRETVLAQREIVAGSPPARSDATGTQDDFASDATLVEIKDSLLRIEAMLAKAQEQQTK
jgi:putative membrane protein